MRNKQVLQIVEPKLVAAFLGGVLGRDLVQVVVVHVDRRSQRLGNRRIVPVLLFLALHLIFILYYN